MRQTRIYVMHIVAIRRQCTGNNFNGMAQLADAGPSPGAVPQAAHTENAKHQTPSSIDFNKSKRHMCTEERGSARRAITAPRHQTHSARVTASPGGALLRLPPVLKSSRLLLPDAPALELAQPPGPQPQRGTRAQRFTTAPPLDQAEKPTT